MLATVLQLDQQQHIGLHLGEAVDHDHLTGQRFSVIFIGCMFDLRTRHVLQRWRTHQFQAFGKLRGNVQYLVATRGHFPGDRKQAGILFLDIQQCGTDFIGCG